MELALAQAQKALAAGEVAVGAVVVKDGAVIGVGRNRRETEKTALAHAELEAIHQACKAIGDWRLTGCTLYVTLEPCVMCFGAILNARLSAVVFGAYDEAAGCVSRADLLSCAMAPQPKLIGGFLLDECKTLLQTSFQALRA